MAQVITPNVYKIDGNDISVKRFGFPTSSLVLSPAPANTRTASGVNLYGIIELKPQGLEVLQGSKFFTVETVAQLADLANA